MQKDELINENNLFDFYEKDLKGMEETLKTLDIDTTPEDLPQKPIRNKKCRCGNSLFESPKGQFRCSQCGCIKYDKKEA